MVQEILAVFAALALLVALVASLVAVVVAAAAAVVAWNHWFPELETASESPFPYRGNSITIWQHSLLARDHLPALVVW